MGRFDKFNLRGFVIRKDNGSKNSLFLSCQMGLSDGAFFMIKHTPLPNRNHPIASPVCPMGVADTLEHIYYLPKYLVPLPPYFQAQTKMALKSKMQTVNFRMRCRSKLQEMNILSITLIGAMIKSGRYPEVKSKPLVNLVKAVLAKFGKERLKIFLEVMSVELWLLSKL